jgi:hypothetical protein
MGFDGIALSVWEITIEIVGLPTRIVFDGIPLVLKKQLGEWYSAFAITSGYELTQVRVSVKPGEVFIPLKPGPWPILTSELDGQVEFASYYEKGWFNLDTSFGELLMRPEGNLENFLRVLYAWRCLTQEALLLHASGLVRDGRGYVFFGPSGSGKTTVTRLSEGALVLSDDLVILKCEDMDGEPSVRVYGAPFRGELAEAARSNASAPLAGLFSLVKDERHFTKEISPSVADARLVASVPFVTGQPSGAGRALALCAEISCRVQVKELHFRRDPGFWEVIDV